MRIEAAGRSNVGRCRERNEDALLIEEELKLFLVADACGSASYAAESIDVIASYLKETQTQQLLQPLQLSQKTVTKHRLSTAVELANHTLQQKKQLGVAMVGAFFIGELAFFTHVGDCRAYRLQGDSFEQLTEDHTLLNEYLKRGMLAPEEIEDFPHKNVIIKALGMQEFQVDILTLSPKDGDIFLLCSDGLSEDVTALEMKSIIQRASSLEAACEALLLAADQKRGSDNATVVLLRWLKA